MAASFSMADSSLEFVCVWALCTYEKISNYFFIDFSDITYASVHFVSLHMERCYAIFKDDTFPLGIPYRCRFRRGIILAWKDKILCHARGNCQTASFENYK